MERIYALKFNIVTQEVLAIIISLIMIISNLLSERQKTRLNSLFKLILLSNGVVLFCDMISWIFDGSTLPYARAVLWVTDFAVIVFCLPFSAIYMDYIITYIYKKANVARKLAGAFYASYGVFVVITIAAQLNGMCFYIDESNRYVRGSLFWIPYIMPTISLVINTYLILKHVRKLGAKDTIVLLGYLFLPFAGIVLQYYFYGFISIYAVNAIAWLIIYVQIHVEQSKQLTQQELELANARIDIMLSQIQPHFLYNTLQTIKTFCIKDGETAAKLVQDFSDYIRDNMDSLSQRGLVHFERELKHIETYCRIEKLRFDERIHFITDFETTDFYLPILSVQPLVENAVHHGITKKPGGGTVRISTRLLRDGVLISVTDDGIGFDASKSVQGRRSHVGIENVRSRIETQCGGTLTVSGVVDAGTVASITIPLK